MIMDDKRAIRRRKGVQQRPTKYLQNGHTENGVRNPIPVEFSDSSVEGKDAYTWLHDMVFNVLDTSQ